MQGTYFSCCCLYLLSLHPTDCCTYYNQVSPHYFSEIPLIKGHSVLHTAHRGSVLELSSYYLSSTPYYALFLEKCTQ